MPMPALTSIIGEMDSELNDGIRRSECKVSRFGAGAVGGRIRRGQWK